MNNPQTKISSNNAGIGSKVLISVLLVFLGIQAFSQNAVKEFLKLLETAQGLTNTKRWFEAAPVWEKVIQKNPTNGFYYSQLGNAYYNSGQYNKATPAFESQFALGYGILENIAYDIACNYALAGDRQRSLDWLQKAFDAGFKSYTHPLTDSDLKSVRNEPRFAKILAIADVSKMTRTEAWRFDLDLLKREVVRKAYRSSPGLRFDSVLQRIESLKSRIPELNDNEIVIEILRTMVKVGDGHSSMLPPVHLPIYKYSLPVQFYLFKEGMYIISADPKYKDLLGGQVIDFGGQNIETIERTLEPLIHRDNYMGVPTRYPYMMRYLGLMNSLRLIPNDRNVNVKLKGLDGKVQTVNLVADTTEPVIWNTLPNPATWINLPQILNTPMPGYLKNMDQRYWFETSNDNRMVYCQINSLTNNPKEPFGAFCERLYKAINESNVEKLVLDFRWNNGGNGTLTTQLLQALLRTEKINKKGNLFVIIGRRTYSAAQITIGYLERFTNSIFVGEPSGSSPNFVGEEDFLTLPYSKIMLNVSDVMWQGSWATDRRTWISPLIYTPPTFSHYSINTDPAMEGIMQYIENNQ